MLILIHVKRGKPLEMCMLRTEHRKKYAKSVVLDVSYSIDTDISGEKSGTKLNP